MTRRSTRPHRPIAGHPTPGVTMKLQTTLLSLAVITGSPL